MKLKTILLAALVLAASCTKKPADGLHHLVVISTGDVHGSYFDQPYVDGQHTRTSLMSVKKFVDMARESEGEDNVLLIDAGDILQGDNAAYYYNYVATDQPHIFPLLADYIGYDVCVLGNHDIETGHGVYDRVARELKSKGIQWLAGNAVKPNGKSYFPMYTIVEKAGMRIAVLGFDNANIKAWLSEELWDGMSFESLVPFVQGCVDKVIKKEKPDMVIVAAHSGTGEGDGTQLENQGLDLYNSLKGVDLVIGAHDHRPYKISDGEKAYVDGGARAGNVGLVIFEPCFENGEKVMSSVFVCDFVKLDKADVDTVMREHFRPQFEAVKEFTLRKVGSLAMPLRTRDAYTGMCDYLNLIHTVQLSAKEATISLAAPLTFNGEVKAGELIYNDMFTIYPFENQLFVVRMTGKEIKDFLEYSYDNWIMTPGEHLLRIHPYNDERTSSAAWSFYARPYNFDSAAGINYEVDVTEPCGSRVKISSLSDGKAFDMDASYNVAMTSYRANGGGRTMPEGAGIDAAELDSRVVARYPEIREMIYEYIKSLPEVTPESVGDRGVIGEWKFVPEEVAAPLLEDDMRLVFP